MPNKHCLNTPLRRNNLVREKKYQWLHLNLERMKHYYNRLLKFVLRAERHSCFSRLNVCCPKIFTWDGHSWLLKFFGHNLLVYYIDDDNKQLQCTYNLSKTKERYIKPKRKIQEVKIWTSLNDFLQLRSYYYGQQI